MTRYCCWRLLAWIALALVTAPAVLAADRWALVIGVNKTSGFNDLSVCAADALAMKDVLQKVGYPASHIKVLTDTAPTPATWPSRDTIEEQVARTCEFAEKGDTVLIFFSGHGIIQNDDNYILPVNGKGKAIAVRWLQDQLAASKASGKVLILDACHSGAKGMGGIAPDMKAGGSVALLYSCGRDQVSWPDEKNEHSIFTRFLLEGLSGKAAGADRKVTVSGLHAFVRSQVKTWSFEHNRQQFPVLGGGASEDLVLAECPEEAVAVEPPPKPPIPAPQPPRPTELARSLSLDCGDGVEMKLVLIPSGEFMMGSPGDEADRSNDEGPQHRVTITKPFYIGICEVTQAQFGAVMGTDLSNFKGPSNPVECVSWDDAQEFCRKLSAKTGQTRSAAAPFLVRLPTEAEWEYACRAGTTSAFSFGDTISTDQANYDGNYTYGSGRKGLYRQKTTPAGSFGANALGLFDMHGNVWEWCQDWYGSYPGNELVDPQGPTNGELRVVRGGCWFSFPWFCRSAARGRGDPSGRYNFVGFRVVCAPRP